MLKAKYTEIYSKVKTTGRTLLDFSTSQKLSLSGLSKLMNELNYNEPDKEYILSAYKELLSFKTSVSGDKEVNSAMIVI